MATIPTDVIHSCILPRLPVKSLTRFKSVSKTWQTIISSPEFIHLHHQHAVSSNDNRLIVIKEGLTFQIHELDSPLSPSLLWYNPEPVPFAIDILASCEFFLLIDFHGILGLVLLNPSTGRYYKIPYQSNNYLSYYAMYLDEYNHDYKVVKTTRKFCFRAEKCVKINIEVMVYSLRTNKWRLIEQTLDKCYVWCVVTNVIIGNFLHIVYILDNTNAKKRIGCFDILAEKWTNDDVPMPQINDLGDFGLAVLDGLLCATGVETEETGSHKWCVWVMKEYGVKDSWFKLMSIASDDILYLDINPIAFRKGSPHEVLCRRISSYEFIWYNVREKKATTAATLNGVIPKAIIVGIDGYICKGSLVDFPGGRNMKLRQPKQAKQS